MKSCAEAARFFQEAEKALIPIAFEGLADARGSEGPRDSKALTEPRL
jgi:hypothetical protein